MTQDSISTSTELPVETQVADQPPQAEIAPQMNAEVSWTAPIRPFRKREREFYTTAGSIIFLVCLILLFLKEFLFIMVLIALAFFVYILSTVPPEEVEHKLTYKGIITGGKTYPWDQLGTFWFDTKWGNEVLVVENLHGWPSRLLLLLGSLDHKTAEAYMGQFLDMDKPEKTQMEKAGDWLQQKIPLETASAPVSPSPDQILKK